tara:strand:+ start:1071 stop:1274 length:204 start_codon:yes stop_codon:yes gene_type:complete
MGSKRTKEFMIKRVYQTDTYLLYSKGKMLIYCVVDHKEASREPLEIGRQILSDAKDIEGTSFLLRHI